MGKFTLFKPEPKPPAPPRPRGPAPEPPLFSQLLPCTWRDINFPTSSIKVSFSQDITEHKYWGVDGADVESTGRAPMEIDLVIPCYNGIVPGKSEKWGKLYPTVFRKLFEAVGDKSVGVLQHPELGDINCKPVSFDFTLDAQRRDGVEITIKLVETIFEDEAFDVTAFSSPIATVDIAALDLDSSKVELTLLVPEAEGPLDDIFNVLTKVTAFVDTATTTIQVLGNKPNQALYRLEQLQNSVDRAKNALTWPITDTIEKAKNALLDIKEAFATTHTVEGTGIGPAPETQTGGVRQGVVLSTSPSFERRKTARYLTPTAMTASQIQTSLPSSNSMDELIGLNPVLVSVPEISQGVVIRYYVK